MNRRTLILLGIAFLIAVVTAIGVKSRMSGPHAQQASGTRVMVAVVPIPAGTFVRADKELGFADWPKANLQPWHLTQAAHTAAEFNGAVARRNIAAGEAINANMLVKTSEGGFMSAVLTPGKRAVSIAVNEVSGNAGFIFPGDRVDLIVTHRVNLGQNGESNAKSFVASETFVRDVRVLAIDQMLDNPENKAMVAKSVTLEVTPKQAEMIQVAADLGKISLVLRSLGTGLPVTPAEAAAAATPAPTPSPEAAKAAAEVDPFFADKIETEKGAPVPDESHYTVDTDISNVMRDEPVYPQITIIHGEKAEKIQFDQGGNP